MSSRRKIILIAGSIVLVVASAIAAFAAFKWSPRPSNNSLLGSGNMKIISPEFEQNGPIPGRYTCDGANISPPLRISGAPEETQTLVLIVDDPDATFGVFTHWTVWNIPAGTADIAENSAPGGVIEGRTDFGRSGYGGPCPPSGEHRYFFKVYALDVKLDLTPEADVKELEAAMQAHVLDKAGLIGVYRRQQ